ncbi:MAG TPA: hypothetical protein VEH81_15565 [Ktedonobacteraceae bacterium]|nr:hypothetical protein [Ktedonobacteraceae bacterium]
MKEGTQPENASGDCQQSGKYEYTVHPAETLTLQIFNTKTMSSAFFTAEETLALLDYLTEHRRQIATITTDAAK